MRRFATILLCCMLLAVTVLTVSATGTTLTIDVPELSYVLHIPADQAIEYRAARASIGGVSVSGVSGFSESQELRVEVSYSGQFTCPGQSSVINYFLASKEYGVDTIYSLDPGAVIQFRGNGDGTLSSSPVLLDGSPADEIVVVIDTACWDSVQGGQYSTTITFDAYVYTYGT